ncbi:hypothetical protein OBBRIDRAFT_890823 [Obba rivulosa]|uniref:Uncharacterized protein n=1 Tax=Obba rivulosa TaxID=1052685 RepID=A0A8E2DGH3_9APHY|nr:hypothetical protein OBBRIDRAFT_890823 [Obba rivulosa]
MSSREGRGVPPRGQRGGPPSQRHKVYEPGKRYMELVPSVSRSSGLDKDGDALRDLAFQEEYRVFVHGKAEEYWKRFPLGAALNEEDRKQREEVQGNLLILFRKLREGILSTNRRDAFAIEVYESSLYLSVIFKAAAQTTSTLSHLLPLYTRQSDPAASDAASASTPRQPGAAPVLLALLHALHTTYPSQRGFHEQVRALPPAFLPRSSDAHHWVHDLARCLRRCEYARLERLTELAAFAHFVGDRPGPGGPGAAAPDLPLEALRTLVDAIRVQARMTAWRIVRSAYRELACPPASLAAGSETSMWLVRSLALRSWERGDLRDAERVEGSSVEGKEAEMEERRLAEQWLVARCKEGEVKEKEGVEGRWILLRTPAK